MDQGLVWLNALIVILGAAGGGLYLYARASQRARLLARTVFEVQRRHVLTVNPRTEKVTSRVAQVLRRIGVRVPLFSAGQRQEASSKLVSAGYRSPQALFVLMGLSLLSILVLLSVVAWLARPYLQGHGTIAWGLLVLMCVYVGNMLPRLVLDRLVRRRQEAVRQSLPDALDLLVICTNAGLALNSALERVADELEVVAPALADELKLTATELKISSDIEVVLEGLASRTGIDGMRTLVSTFLQARQYGTSITHALRVLARSERTARMMRLEEKAAKLSVKMTIPMMLFVLPTVLIVGIGPAIMSLGKTLSSF